MYQYYVKVVPTMYVYLDEVSNENLFLPIEDLLPIELHLSSIL